MKLFIVWLVLSALCLIFFFEFFKWNSYFLDLWASGHWLWPLLFFSTEGAVVMVILETRK